MRQSEDTHSDSLMCCVILASVALVVILPMAVWAFLCWWFKPGD